jgi:hypothetical protein
MSLRRGQEDTCTACVAVLLRLVCWRCRRAAACTTCMAVLQCSGEVAGGAGWLRWVSGGTKTGALAGLRAHAATVRGGGHVAAVATAHAWPRSGSRCGAYIMAGWQPDHRQAQRMPGVEGSGAGACRGAARQPQKIWSRGAADRRRSMLPCGRCKGQRPTGVPARHSSGQAQMVARVAIFRRGNWGGGGAWDA